MKFTPSSERPRRGIALAICSMVAMLALTGCLSEEPKQQVDTLYFGGDILTMQGDVPEYVEAAAIKNGTIVFIGSLDQAQRLAGKRTKRVDLHGATLMPGFIDSHSHVSIFTQQMTWANLSPTPAGRVTQISDIVDELQKTQREQGLAKDEWLLGMGYDVDYLAERRHPSAADLDAAFPETPVVIMHVSGHMVVANSIAMRLKGVTITTEDPPGGEIVRLSDGQTPHGLIKETALIVHFLDVLMPKASLDAQSLQLNKALNYYASKGVTTAQEGAALPVSVEVLKYAAANNLLPIDVVALVRYEGLQELERLQPIVWGEYQGKLKFEGVKLALDGSPQGKSAFLTSPYLTPVEGCDLSCVGIAQMTAQQFEKVMREIYGKGIHVFAHANGDGAIDMLINTHANIVATMAPEQVDDLRTVAIHSQVMRPDQVNSYIKYQILPSFFTNHTYFWGDVHLQNLGEERAGFISPMRASMDGGLTVSNHSDNPVTPIDPLLGVWSAVNRISINGTVIGESQRVSVYEALKATTINAAFQYFEEDSKGSIEVGKKADFVALDHNPLKVPKSEIKKINILYTIKNDAVVFQRDDYR